MTNDLWGGGGGTCLDQHAKNKTMLKFPWGKKKSSKKGFMRSISARTDTSTKDVSKIRLSDESDILLTTFGTSQITQDKIKEVVYQGEFINF